MPDFTLTAKDLKDVGLKDFAGKRKVLNIVPSLDTPVCAKSTKVFNEKAGTTPNTVVLVISADLPVRRRPLLHRRGPRQRGDAVDRCAAEISSRNTAWTSPRAAEGRDGARGGRARREQQGAPFRAGAGDQARSPNYDARSRRSTDARALLGLARRRAGTHRQRRQEDDRRCRGKPEQGQDGIEAGLERDYLLARRAMPRRSGTRTLSGRKSSSPWC